MSEAAPREEPLQAAGVQVITAMQSLAQALTLYDPNNAAVQRILDSMEQGLSAWFGEGGAPLTLQLLPGEYFVNGQLLKVDAVLYERAASLTGKLSPLKISELRFEPGIRRSDLSEFVEDLTRRLRGEALSFREGGYGAFKLGRASGRAVASYRFEPDQLAVWLYTSLVELVERLFDACAQGETPSLVPLRRTLQMVIENISAQRGIYTLLAALTGGANALPRQRAAVALELLGFGRWIGLQGQPLMTLALAGILGGLSPSSDPMEAVRLIFRFPGIGFASIPVTLAIHGARAHGLRASDPAAALLALAERYTAQIRGRDQRADQAIRALQGPAELLSLFAAYQGPYPPGAGLELDDGTRALSISSAEDPERPAVLLITPEGELGAPLDLAEGHRTVRRPLPLSELKLNISQLASETVEGFSTPSLEEEDAPFTVPEDLAEEEAPFTVPESLAEEDSADSFELEIDEGSVDVERPEISEEIPDEDSEDLPTERG